MEAEFPKGVDIHVIYDSISLLDCQAICLGFKKELKVFDDDLDDRSDAEIQALLRGVRGVRAKQGAQSSPGLRKLRMTPKPGLLAPFERGFENLNADIEVTVRLPAYLVAGLSIEGDLSTSVRLAARDWLNSRGKTWWHSRLSSTVAARNLQ